MLRISRLTDYGIAILTFLTKNPEKSYSANEIAKKLHINFPTVSKLLKILVRKNLVQSVRGKQGGYCLGASANQISLAKIITTIEGPINLTQCTCKKSGCYRRPLCQQSTHWRQISFLLNEIFENISLHEMASLLKPLQIRRFVQKQWKTISQSDLYNVKK